MISSIFLSFFGFLLTVMVLITVHEFGHYWVACRCGVRVIRFSIGFGRSLFRWTNRQGTEFTIASIPLGGYVKMLDERIMPVAPELQRYAFNTQPVGKRIAIVGAGPVVNLLFAVFVYWMLYTIGVPGIVPRVGDVVPGSVAAEAGFKKGDEITAVGGEKTSTWGQVEPALLQHYHQAGALFFKVKHASSSSESDVSLVVPTDQKQLLGLDPLTAIGISRYLPPIPAVVGQVLKDSPAGRSGLQTGDKIVSIDGVPISDWTQVVSYVQGNPKKIIRLSLDRSGKVLGLELIAEQKTTPDGRTVGFIGAMHSPFDWPAELKVLERYSIPVAFTKAIAKTSEVCSLTLRLLYWTVVGEVPGKAVGGPISIAKGAGASMDAGFVSFMSFLAVLSISLGLLNLLPIPLLDGGHLFFYLIEAVFRRPVPESIQNIGMRIGFALLVAITLAALYNDLF